MHFDSLHLKRFSSETYKLSNVVNWQCVLSTQCAWDDYKEKKTTFIWTDADI